MVKALLTPGVRANATEPTFSIMPPRLAADWLPALIKHGACQTASSSVPGERSDAMRLISGPSGSLRLLLPRAFSLPSARPMRPAMT